MIATPPQIPAGTNRYLRVALFLLAITVLSGSVRDAEAASFTNLGFEQATVPFPGPASVATVDALPGWTVTIASEVQNSVGYNRTSFNTTDASIHDAAGQLFMPIHEGQYAVHLVGGYHEVHIFTTDVWLSQAGTVPSNAQYIEFVAKPTTAMGDPESIFRVQLDTTSIPVQPVQVLAGNAKRYRGDVSDFAGSPATLRFCVKGDSFVYENRLTLDDIRFVPTPAACAGGMALIGAVALQRRRGQRDE